MRQVAAISCKRARVRQMEEGRVLRRRQERVGTPWMKRCKAAGAARHRA
jgi:hypothetical protein